MLFFVILTSTLIISCTTVPNAVLFSDFFPPPARPILKEVPTDNTLEAIKQLGIHLTTTMTHIEKLEEYQRIEDAYYRKILENSEN